MELLGLTEEELCATLGVDPLTLLSGQLEHRPELPILLALLDEAAERAGPAGAAALGARRRAGRPADRRAGERGTSAAFEDALGELARARLRAARGGGADG